MRALEPDPRAVDDPGVRNERLRGIEGLRALAALAVLLFHVWDGARPASTPVQHPVPSQLADNVFNNLRAGVTLFFVLSGFLLYRPIAAAVIRRLPPPSTRRYLINRALRILPAYWAILAATVLVVDRELLSRPGQLAANVFLIQNYVPDYQPVGFSPLGLGPAWSVVLEVSFYITLPFLGLLAARCAGFRAHRVSAALLGPLIMLAVGIGAHIAFRLQAHNLGQTWEKFTIFNYADWFAAGMCLAVARILWEDGRLRMPRWWKPTALGAAIAVTAVAAKLYATGTLLFNEYQAIIALAAALIISLVVLYDSDTRIVRALEWRPIFLFGLASYSVFLWNDTVIRGLRGHGLIATSAPELVAASIDVLAITVLLSAITYRWIERPALDLKPRQRAGKLQYPREQTGDCVSGQTSA